MQSPVQEHWEHLRKLVETTSGGLDRIVLIGRDEKLRLLLWCSVYVTLTVAMIGFCLSSVRAYSLFPTEASINIEEGNLGVPSIALCSLNPFKRQKLCHEPFAKLCEPGANFADEFAKLAAGAENETYEFVEHYTNAFYNLEDLVVSCTLKGEPCGSPKAEFFSPVIIQVHRFGQCFCMFCEKGREFGKALRTRSEFPRNALVLQLNSSTRDYLPQTEGLGFMFLFFTYRKAAMVTKDAVHVALGESTYMRLETVKMELLPAPYPSKCGSDWPREYSGIEGIGKERYSYTSCMGICFSQQVIKECNCETTMQFSQLSVLDNICRKSLIESRCRTEALGNPGRYRANCKCPTECSMSSYSVQTSRTGFPPTLWKKSFSNFTEVIIYQGLTETTLVREKAKYRFMEMIQAIGSNMNTFTGLTFLVIYETVDVLAAWILYITNETP